jgi:hypothetical protein
MPATGQPPTLRDFLTAYGASIRGARSTTADVRTGSAYDLIGGVSAIVWSRQVQRDRRLFRQVYTDTADGEDLERLVEKKYQVTRIQSTYGTGTLTLTRPAAGAAAGTIYAGTRVEYREKATPVAYVVRQDTVVPAAALAYPIPVRAGRTGPGVSINVDGSWLKLPDPIFDNTFVPTALVCGDGTDQESATEYVARARKAKVDRRNGYATRIIAALEEAGAEEIVLLDAHSLGEANDFGLSYCYVADSGFSASAALIKASMLALDQVIVAGTDVQVLGMTPTPVSVSVTASLVEDPGGLDQVDIKQGIVAALVEEFGKKKSWWWYRTDALAGLVASTSNMIQTASVTTSPAEPAMSFPETLPRFSLQPNAVSITLTGPQ